VTNPIVDAAATPTIARGATGSIYDLGYRGYDGPRLGRRHAIRALFLHTLKVAYGIGRGGRAKIAPVVLGGFAVIPAIVGVGITALARQMGQAGEFAEDANPINHATYFGLITVFVMLFCAIQTPETVGRDQRHSLLSLYFSRALRREDYALARLGGVVVGLFIFVMLPQVIIFGGRVLAATDVGAELGKELALVPPTIAQAVILSTMLGALSTVVSAFTPRRLYATIGIVVLLSVTPLITALLLELGTDTLARVLILASPADVLEATNAFLFGEPSGSDVVRFADLDGIVYLAAAAVITVGCSGIFVRRFQRIVA
jgi:ABC-2 type transport system permease protein